MQFLGDEPKKKNKAKKKVVLVVKRKRDETPEQSLVVEERFTKKTKTFLDAFNSMNLNNDNNNNNNNDNDQTNQAPIISNKKYFRYFGSEKGEPFNFDVNTKLREAQGLSLPTVHSQKQKANLENLKMHFNNNNNNNSNAYTGFITKKERKQGIDILELEHLLLPPNFLRLLLLSHPNFPKELEYHYYYMDEEVNAEKFQNNIVINAMESFMVDYDNEFDEYDEDIQYSDEEGEVDYGDTPSGGSLDSWERDSSDSDSSRDEYSSPDEDYDYEDNDYDDYG